MGLFSEANPLDAYVPRRPTLFEPTRIIIARGSDRNEYADRVAGICALYVVS